MNYKKQKGYTLIELMVGVSVALLVTLGLLAIYVPSLHMFRNNQSSIDLDNKSRFLTSFFQDELKHTGYGGCISETRLSKNKSRYYANFIKQDYYPSWALDFENPLRSLRRKLFPTDEQSKKIEISKLTSILGDFFVSVQARPPQDDDGTYIVVYKENNDDNTFISNSANNNQEFQKSIAGPVVLNKCGMPVKNIVYTNVNYINSKKYSVSMDDTVNCTSEGLNASRIITANQATCSANQDFMSTSIPNKGLELYPITSSVFFVGCASSTNAQINPKNKNGNLCGDKLPSLLTADITRSINSNTTHILGNITELLYGVEYMYVEVGIIHPTNKKPYYIPLAFLESDNISRQNTDDKEFFSGDYSNKLNKGIWQDVPISWQDATSVRLHFIISSNADGEKHMQKEASNLSIPVYSNNEHSYMNSNSEQLEGNPTQETVWVQCNFNKNDNIKDNLQVTNDPCWNSLYLNGTLNPKIMRRIHSITVSLKNV